MLTETHRIRLREIAYELKLMGLQADDGKVIQAYKAVQDCLKVPIVVIDVPFTTVNPYEPGTVNMNRNWKPVS